MTVSIIEVPLKASDLPDDTLVLPEATEPRKKCATNCGDIGCVFGCPWPPVM